MAQIPALMARWRGQFGSLPRHERLGLLALLVATFAFYLYGLTANGYANAFYSAAAQAGSQSWSALFFGSSDAANAITVDKPPAALWIMAASVRLFGLNSLAILLPEVLMGVASVGVLYASVRRYAGHAAGMIAGVVLALTPVAVLMFRFNNPDALLVLLLTVATWATLRATENANLRWLIGAGVCIGFAFLTKTLQAFLIVPVLAGVYLLAAPTTLRRRLRDLFLTGLAVLLSAGWWVAIVELLPTSMRPYIGGSQTNSFLELTFGYNGFGRINGNETGSVGGGNGWGATGIGRLFDSSNGGQISWLIPSALVLLVGGLWLNRRSPRTDIRRAAYLVWGGWLMVTLLVFSFMAGIFHEYYSIALAPAIAAVVGIGVVDLWRRCQTSFAAITLAVATAAAATWSFILLTRVSTSYGPLRFIVLTLGMATALLMLVIGQVHRRVVPVLAATALAIGLAGPAAYSATTVATAHSGSIVTAGPGGRAGGFGPGGAAGPGGAPGFGRQGTGPVGGAPGGMGGLLQASTANADVVAALQDNAQQYTWVAAAIGSQNAAGLQLGSGLPVMSIGGFNGSDPSPTLAQFQQYVADGRIHYFASGGGMGGRGGDSGGTSAQISSWVQANFTPVTIGGSTFYDLTSQLASTGGLS